VLLSRGKGCLSKKIFGAPHIGWIINRPKARGGVAEPMHIDAKTKRFFVRLDTATFIESGCMAILCCDGQRPPGRVPWGGVGRGGYSPANEYRLTDSSSQTRPSSDAEFCLEYSQNVPIYWEGVALANVQEKMKDWRRYCNDERTPGAIGQNPPITPLNHDGLTSPHREQGGKI
jgi:hypothetical protein